MRSLALVFVLAACGSATRGPAWPKPSAGSEDGGESLAPRPSAHELLSEPDPDAVADDATDVTPAAAPSAPEPAAEPEPAAATQSEEPASTETITIEVDDDD